MDTRTVTGKWIDADGSAATGFVRFEPSSVVASTVYDEILSIGRYEVTLDGTGSISVALPVTDGAGDRPASWVWAVTERIDGATARTWNLALPTGSALDLADAVPVTDGTYTPIGDVVAPATSTDNALARYDGTTGTQLQDSQTLEDDSGNVTIAGTLTVAGNLQQDVVAGAAPTFTGANLSALVAANVDIVDSGALITATQVEGALAENRTAIDLNTTHRTSDGSDHSFLDQSVVIGSAPSLLGTNITGLPVTALANGTDGELITWSSAGVAETVATGTAAQVLTSNGVGAAPTFQASAAGITRPGSSTDNALVRWDGTGADTVQDSQITEDDSGNITIAGTVNGGTLEADQASPFNTAWGFNAASANVGGLGNVSVGFEAGLSNTLHFTTYVGAYAGKLNSNQINTGLGYHAMSGGTSGKYTTALGSYALQQVGLGGASYQNVAVGHNAGYSPAALGLTYATKLGSYQTWVGAGTGQSVVSADPADYAVGVGHHATAALYGTALGAYTSVTGAGGTAIGVSSTGVVSSVGHADSVAIHGVSSAANQIMLGTSAHDVVIPGTTASTGYTTGALTVAGGLGVANNIYAASTVQGHYLRASGTNASVLAAGGTSSAASAVQANATKVANFYIQTGTSSNARWSMGKSIVAESGSAVGSDWELTRYDDTGANPNVAILVERATGDATFEAGVSLHGTTASTSSTTGALTVAGGVGVADDLFVGTDLDVTGTVTVGGNLQQDTVSGATPTLTGTNFTGIPVTGLAAGTDGELITWSAAGVAETVAVGTATHVLTSNGAGAAPTFQAAAGGATDIDGLSDASLDVADNIYFGATAPGTITSAYDNVALTSNGTALSALTSGYRNIAIGDAAAPALTTADNNIAIGHESLLKAETGQWNIALGENAIGSGLSETSPYQNIAIGYSAVSHGGDNNVGIGHQAMFTAEGTANIGVGYQALYPGSTSYGNRFVGTYNIAVGYQAYRQLAGSGDYNVVLGHTANVDSTTRNEAIVIGKGLTSGAEDGAIAIGSTDVAGNILRVESGVLTIGGAAWISLASLQTETAAASDFADFQSKIAAL